MRTILSIVLIALGAVSASTVSAQSSISNRPFELTLTKGAWGALLPGYDAGINDDGASAFQDDGDTLGALGELKAVRRFLGTRTSFEAKGFYGLAEANVNTGPIGVDIANPITGASNVFSGGRTHLDADVDHYGFDFALRDTWQTQFGGLSAGCGFSYMAFDQDYDVRYAGNRLFKEELDSDFRGGKAFAGWDGLFLGRKSNLDFTVGYYDVNAEYRYNGGVIAGSAVEEFGTNTSTFETEFTTRTTLKGCQVGLTLAAMYIADMPTIDRDVAGLAFVATDDAATIRAMIEILL